MNDMTKKMFKQLRMLEVQNKNIIDSEFKFSHLDLSEQQLNQDLSHSEDNSELLFDQIVRSLNVSGHSVEKITQLINESMASKHTNLPYCDQNEVNEALNRKTH